MKKSICFIFTISIAMAAIAQNEVKDPKAKEILDELSEKTKSYKTIVSDFSFTMENQQEDISESYDGKVRIKGNKYRLSLMDSEIYCDGKTIWTHIVESDEVNITNRDLEDKTFLNNPQSIFTMYEEGYKYSYKGEIKEHTGSFSHIELYPEEVAQGLEPGDQEISDLSKIVIIVDTNLNRIRTFTYYTKNGNIYTINLNKFKVNIPIGDADFTFDTAAYPDVEVIDLRD
ncbi:MAG: outer membrane lipoprotein carrier protein LolA [Bacteroidota bacterium]|nr:outer membrane lipoprotein carrier protein LolA [Bacteroidota bacterium]